MDKNELNLDSGRSSFGQAKSSWRPSSNRHRQSRTNPIRYDYTVGHSDNRSITDDLHSSVRISPTEWKWLKTRSSMQQRWPMLTTSSLQCLRWEECGGEGDDWEIAPSSTPWQWFITGLRNASGREGNPIVRRTKAENCHCKSTRQVRKREGWRNLSLISSEILEFFSSTRQLLHLTWRVRRCSSFDSSSKDQRSSLFSLRSFKML